jgi:hypothetical protein
MESKSSSCPKSNASATEKNKFKFLNKIQHHKQQKNTIIDTFKSPFPFSHMSGLKV